MSIRHLTPHLDSPPYHGTPRSDDDLVAAIKTLVYDTGGLEYASVQVMAQGLLYFSLEITTGYMYTFYYDNTLGAVCGDIGVWRYFEAKSFFQILLHPRRYLTCYRYVPHDGRRIAEVMDKIIVHIALKVTAAHAAGHRSL